jgi:EAL domain-containing protein (putative c-di-GMP-specific phosphodiesterase class I)
MRLFVNVSPETLEHPSFSVENIRGQIVAAGLVPEQIVFEVTERRISTISVLAQRAAELRALGIGVAIDDTGVGYAGLEVLSKVPLDYIKIDRSLVVKSREQSAARAVLSGIIAIARETGTFLIAEGIETLDTLEYVRTAHLRPSDADETARIFGGQGYLLGRPMIGKLDVLMFERYDESTSAAG